MIEIEKEVVELYKCGNSSYKLAKQFDINKKTILNILKRNNIKRRIYKLYSYDKNYFKEIDTEDKAYFLGFMFSDGNNSIKNFKLALGAVDLHILEAFKKYLKSNSKIYRYKTKNGKYQDSVVLSIYDRMMCDDLSKLGVIPNKSLKIKYPEYLDYKLQKHFIRGLFDGDGSFSYNININKHIRTQIGILGTINLCNGIKKVIKNNLNINCGVYKSKNIYVLKCGRNKDVVKIMDWLYDCNNELKLSRKYDKYMKVRDLMSRKFYEFKTYEDCKQYIKNMNIKNQREWTEYCKSGKKPNFIPSSVSKIFKNNGWISWNDFLNKENKQ